MNWNKLRRALTHPRMAWRTARGLARGWYYRVKFRVLGQRVIIGRGFEVLGPLIIRGPGTVIFGDHCTVSGTWRYPTTPFTHSPAAVIRFGNRVRMASTRFGCANRIEVEDDAGLSDARIMDTDYHAVEVSGTHRANTTGRSKPVRIGRNAWVGAGSMVLKGVNVGDNAVVGAGAVVMQNVPANCVVAGNPARVVWRIGNRVSTVLPAEPAADQPAPTLSES